jgi:dynactin complex subunit
MEVNLNPQFYPGKRLLLDSDLLTIRYVGSVPGTEGLWLGVEWDDATKGRHSGEHNGVRYFHCEWRIQVLYN